MSDHDHIFVEPTPPPASQAEATPSPEIEPAQPVSQTVEPVPVFEAVPTPEAEPTQPEAPPHPVDPVRAAAGRLGGRRMHELVRLGQEYEREHGLKAGRQRQRQLIQLGRRYEQEHGLKAPIVRRRKKKGDAWKEFLTALARVVKPAHRPAIEQLVAALQPPRAAA